MGKKLKVSRDGRSKPTPKYVKLIGSVASAANGVIGLSIMQSHDVLGTIFLILCFISLVGKDYFYEENDNDRTS